MTNNLTCNARLTLRKQKDANATRKQQESINSHKAIMCPIMHTGIQIAKIIVHPLLVLSTIVMSLSCNKHIYIHSMYVCCHAYIIGAFPLRIQRNGVSIIMHALIEAICPLTSTKPRNLHYHAQNTDIRSWNQSIYRCAAAMAHYFHSLYGPALNWLLVARPCLCECEKINTITCWSVVLTANVNTLH